MSSAVSVVLSFKASHNALTPRTPILFPVAISTHVTKYGLCKRIHKWGALTRKGKHTIEADWCKHWFFTLQHMAQCNSTTITNAIPCPLPFIHLIRLHHSQKHHPQQTLHVHFCQCCVFHQRLTKHIHTIISNAVVCPHKPHNMPSIQ